MPTPARRRTTVTPGEALRELRRLQGLTQAELAERAGMRQAHVSALESGARQIGRARAEALGRALRVHPGVILWPDWKA